MQLIAPALPYLHILSAFYWTGALVFLAIVATPLMNRVRPPSFQKAVARSMWLAAHRSLWIALGILVFTGLIQMLNAGTIGPHLLTVSMLRTPLGQKLALVGFMILLSLLHDLWLGWGKRFRDPELSTDPPGIVGRAIPWVLAAGAVAVSLLSIMMRLSRA